jgi:hypothetical protein
MHALFFSSESCDNCSKTEKYLFEKGGQFTCRTGITATKKFENKRFWGLYSIIVLRNGIGQFVQKLFDWLCKHNFNHGV